MIWKPQPELPAIARSMLQHCESLKDKIVDVHLTSRFSVTHFHHTSIVRYCSFVLHSPFIERMLTVGSVFDYCSFTVRSALVHGLPSARLSFVQCYFTVTIHVDQIYFCDGLVQLTIENYL
jgi:hypothetical protein